MRSIEFPKSGDVDFTVDNRPVFTLDNTGEYMRLKKHRANVRTDTDSLLGIVGKGYGTMQNDVLLNSFLPYIDAASGIPVSNGSFNGGESVYWQYKTGTCEVGNDQIDEYILLAGSHGGSLPNLFMRTFVRVWCSNTFQAAVKGCKNKFSVKHTKNGVDNWLKASAVMAQDAKYANKFFDLLNQLSSKKIDGNVLQEFIRRLMPAKNEQKVHTKTRKNRELVQQAFEESPGSKRESLYDAYNGATQYIDHMRRLKGEDEGHSRFVASNFGSGVALRDHAFRVAVQLIG